MNEQPVQIDDNTSEPKNFPELTQFFDSNVKIKGFLIRNEHYSLLLERLSKGQSLAEIAEELTLIDTTDPRLLLELNSLRNDFQSIFKRRAEKLPPIGRAFAQAMLFTKCIRRSNETTDLVIVNHLLGVITTKDVFFNSLAMRDAVRKLPTYDTFFNDGTDALISKEPMKVDIVDYLTPRLFKGILPPTLKEVLLVGARHSSYDELINFIALRTYTPKETVAIEVDLFVQMLENSLLYETASANWSFEEKFYRNRTFEIQRIITFLANQVVNQSKQR